MNYAILIEHTWYTYINAIFGFLDTQISNSTEYKTIKPYN